MLDQCVLYMGSDSLEGILAEFRIGKDQGMSKLLQFPFETIQLNYSIVKMGENLTALSVVVFHWVLCFCLLQFVRVLGVTGMTSLISWQNSTRLRLSL